MYNGRSLYIMYTIHIFILFTTWGNVGWMENVGWKMLDGKCSKSQN